MKENIKELIESNRSAVLLNVPHEAVKDLIDFIESYNYPVEVLSTDQDHASVRFGFINGLNEYRGSEDFVKARIFSELNALNELLEVNLDAYYLNYCVEWIHHIHVMNTPLNYLDQDHALFDTLIMFFEDRFYESQSVEDEVAIKFLKIAEELLFTQEPQKIMQFRDQLFKRPSLLIVSEESHLKSLIIERFIKDYYDQYLAIESLDDQLLFVKVQH